MFYAKNNTLLPLCVAVKYKHEKTSTCNYSTSPRPCHNIVFILEGEGIIQTETDNFTVKYGDILLIPLGTTYISTWKAQPQTTFHSLHFNFTKQNDPFQETHIPVQKIHAADFEELYEILLQFQKHQYSRDTGSFLALAYFYSLLAKILPRVKHTHEPATHNPVANAIEYIEQNYASPCTVETLASLCFLSPSRFFYHFKKQTGLSPIAYKNQICIRNAARTLLIEKHKSIEEISEEYGFESAVYFRRLFKSITGKTPKQFKNEETLL